MALFKSKGWRGRSIISAHIRTSTDNLSIDAHTTPDSVFIILFCPMPSWTVGHPSPMFYTSKPSTFLITPMPTTMYRPFMYQASTESPLVIPSMYGTQHSYAHSLFVTQTPQGSLFYQGGSSSQPSIPRPENAR
ncbi:hypothetical protein J1N35_011738 [Gossypium stocksii]|uniref:Uncharacterized protein n=1 Tax=Gossypium stocksii TaxID=47602 RepID=A0A9D4ADM4_9ROSI|nr:hypothetical protein J1N35_011738 [Gossypium stocksii]